LLRIGDFSLVDLKSLDVVGGCEIKTKKKNSTQIDITASFVTKKKPIKFKVNAPPTKKSVTENILDGKIKDKIKRQTQMIAKAIESKKSALERKRIDVNKNNDKFEEFYNSNKEFFTIDEDLIIAKYKYIKSFSERLHFTKATEFHINKDRLKEEIKTKLVNLNSKHNSLWLGSLLYQDNNQPMEIPGFYSLFWEPIDIKLLKDIYFSNNIYITIFNPSYLIERLEKLGVEISVDKQKLKGAIKIGKKTISLESLNYYVILHIHFFYNLESIIDMISMQIDTVKNMKLKKPTRVNFEIINAELFK